MQLWDFLSDTCGMDNVPKTWWIACFLSLRALHVDYVIRALTERKVTLVLVVKEKGTEK